MTTEEVELVHAVSTRAALLSWSLVLWRIRSAGEEKWVLVLSDSRESVFLVEYRTRRFSWCGRDGVLVMLNALAFCMTRSSLTFMLLLTVRERLVIWPHHLLLLFILFIHSRRIHVWIYNFILAVTVTSFLSVVSLTVGVRKASLLTPSLTKRLDRLALGQDSGVSWRKWPSSLLSLFRWRVYMANPLTFWHLFRVSLTVARMVADWAHPLSPTGTLCINWSGDSLHWLLASETALVFVDTRRVE